MKLPPELQSYDPNFIYLGPNGHWSKKFIPKTPIGIPELFPYWNKATYNHDVGYFGIKEADLVSWWNPIKKLLAIRKDRRNRLRIDRQMNLEMMAGIEAMKDELSFEQHARAVEYADLVLESVRVGGWLFYRPGVEE